MNLDHAREERSGGVLLWELAQDAQRLFAEEEPSGKRRLLNFVLSNSLWKNRRADRDVSSTV
jgi:hypothetical protein